MEQIKRIKDLYEKEGESLRGVSRITGHAFETVKNYLEKDDFNHQLMVKQTRKGKLDPYKATIDDWLINDLNSNRKQRHTAKRVYDRLKKIHGAAFTVSDRSVRKYVSQRKKELWSETEGFLPLEHPPGEAQVDFGQADLIERGQRVKGYYVNVSFPNSNGGYLQVFRAENQECLLEGLKNVFEHMGGSPTHLWFDNLSTAVKAIKKHGERDLTKGFERFMLHYGFNSNFCNPNSGHEKGHVETKVGYHRRNMLVPAPEISDIQEFNRELLRLCDEDMRGSLSAARTRERTKD